MTKQTLIKGLAILLIGIVLGAWLFHSSRLQVAGSSPAGSTFTTEKISAVAINLANPGTNGTSTSILNTDANNRIVTALKLGCTGIGSSFTAGTGAGLLNLTMTVGTSSTATPNPLSYGTTNPILWNGVVSTSSASLVISSTTAPIVLGATATSSYADIWQPGTYMSFMFNATNTAACTVGVAYMGS